MIENRIKMEKREVKRINENHLKIQQYDRSGTRIGGMSSAIAQPMYAEQMLSLR